MNKKLALHSARSFIKNRVPGQAVFQFTDFCNAKCPQCGMRVNERFKRSKMDTGRLKTMLDRAKDNGIVSVSFTGGEPFLHMQDLFSVLKHASNLNFPYIRTGTNGYFMTNPESPSFEKRINYVADNLADTKLNTFWISLDTWDLKKHERLRGLATVTDGMRKALPIFHSKGIYPSVNLGINRETAATPLTPEDAEKSPGRYYESFLTGFRKFYSTAVDLGFTIANACYPMSCEDSAVYKAESAHSMVNFTDFEKHLIYKALYDVIPEFRSKIRIFTPRSSLYSLMNEKYGSKKTNYACRGGVDFFFIDANSGNTFPCGFKSDQNLGPFEYFKPSFVSRKPTCRDCDWECFRDPSALTEPFIELFRKPHMLMYRAFSDPKYFKNLLVDLKYYNACGFFNCRTDMHDLKMSKFKTELLYV